MPSSVKVGAYAGEQKKRGRAEVGDPANHEVESPCLVDVLRFEGNIADEVAGMVEGHEDHGEAADKVDGGYSVIAPIGILEVGV